MSSDMQMRYVITKLNNTNYFVWKFKMQLLLSKEGTWECIKENAPDPMTSEWRKKDGQAYSTIGLNVDDDQLVHLRGTTTAKSAWNVLRLYHEKSTANSMKRVLSIKLNEDGNIETHVAQVNEAFQQMNDLGKEITPEDWYVAVLLGSLPDSYDTLVTSLESRNESDLTVAVVQSRVIDEWKRRQFKLDSSM